MLKVGNVECACILGILSGMIGDKYKCMVVRFSFTVNLVVYCGIYSRSQYIYMYMCMYACHAWYFVIRAQLAAPCVLHV